MLRFEPHKTCRVRLRHKIVQVIFGLQSLRRSVQLSTSSRLTRRWAASKMKRAHVSFGPRVIPSTQVQKSYTDANDVVHLVVLHDPLVGVHDSVRAYVHRDRTLSCFVSFRSERITRRGLQRARFIPAGIGRSRPCFRVLHC